VVPATASSRAAARGSIGALEVAGAGARVAGTGGRGDIARVGPAVLAVAAVVATGRGATRPDAHALNSATKTAPANFRTAKG
jgi:hypothetical protein